MPSRPAGRCDRCGARCPGRRCRGCRPKRRPQYRPHYAGDYQRRAKAIRDAANADPMTLCRRCSLPARPGDPWEAGHVVDGDPSSPLAPEHRSCNRSAGGKLSGGRHG